MQNKIFYYLNLFLIIYFKNLYDLLELLLLNMYRYIALSKWFMHYIVSYIMIICVKRNN